MTKMMTIQVMNEPYYDNDTLHPVGSKFQVPEGQFDFGRRGNFGLVMRNGEVKVPLVKTEAMREAERRKAEIEYVWEDGTNPSSDAPIYPETAGIKMSKPTQGARSVASTQPTRVQPPPARVPASMPSDDGGDGGDSGTGPVPKSTAATAPSAPKSTAGSAPTTKS